MEQQNACGGQPRGSNPKWVRVVNQTCNRSAVIRRKDGDRLVNQGRAAWISSDQLRLNPNHPVNRANATAAADGYDSAVMPAHCGDRPDLNELRKTDPGRYDTVWKRRHDLPKRSGWRENQMGAKGALGQTAPNRTIYLNQDHVSLEEKTQ